MNLYLNAADIYVSTNMYGNLSNANLEALSAGACLVLPTSEPSLPLDTVTDRLIPPGTAHVMNGMRCRVPSRKRFAGLCDRRTGSRHSVREPGRSHIR